jgi:hypothetical protein
MPFTKGISGNPAGRAGLDPVVRFNLKQAAREHCPEALDVIAECMRSKDERVAIAAASIMLERGYGKPEQHADIEVSHRFVIAPNTMQIDAWLESKGQQTPALPPPDEKDKPN